MGNVVEKEMPQNGNPLPEIAVGAAVTLCVFVLYLGTLAPTVLGFEPPAVFDSAMLQTASCTLGIAHPTGYSTYLMLTHLFTYLPFGDVAYRVNLASAVFGAVAVFFVYQIGLKLTARISAAAIGALAFGMSATFWSQAVIAEVYTLNALFMSATILTLLVWRDSGQSRFLLLVCFLMGISLTHHLTSALLVPAALAFAYLSRRTISLSGRIVSKGIGLFLLSLTPYLYFPVRAAMDAPLNESDPSTPGRFLLLVTGGGFVFRDVPPDTSAPPPEVSTLEVATTRLSDYLGYLSEQFPLVLVAVGVVGVIHLVLRDRAVTALLGFPLAGSLLHGLFYGYEDYFLFLIPAYMVFGVCICAGVSSLSGFFGDKGRFIVPLLLLAAVVIGIPGTFYEQDRSRDLSGRQTIEAVAEYAEPGATILHHRSSLWYMVLVEGRRKDLTLVDPYRTSFQRYTDIVWPDDLDGSESAAMYGTDDLTGVETARRVSADGAVYILGREVADGTADVSDFREAGFRVVEVDGGGELYELVPQ